MSGSNNPFDQPDFGRPAPQESSGLFGVSPSTWQNIAALGAGAIQGANARTADGHLANGTGIAGGLAGAAQGYLGNLAQQGQSRHLAAQTYGLGIQNQLNAYKLPQARAQANFLAGIYSDPNPGAAVGRFVQGLDQQGGDYSNNPNPYTSGNAFTTPPGGGQPNLTGAMHQLESGGRTNTPGIIGDGGQAFGPAQVHPAALADVNQQYGTNFTPQQLADNPQLGTQVGDAYLKMQQQRFPGNPKAALAAYNAGPTATAQALQSPQGLGALPQSTQNYVARGQQLAGVPQQGQQANISIPQLAQHYLNLARAADLGLPFVGDAATNRGIAQQIITQSNAPVVAGASRAAELPAELAGKGFALGPNGTQQPVTGGAADPRYIGAVEAAKTGAQKQAELNYTGPLLAAKLPYTLAEKQGESDIAVGAEGPKTLAKTLNSPVELRQGALTGVPDGKGGVAWIKNPGILETQDTQGTTTPMHVSPAPPGSPPGTPGTAEPILGPGGQPVITKMPPNVQDALNKAYGDFAGKDTDSFVAAHNAQGVLTQMNEAARTLNEHGGMLGTGPFAPERLAFASKVNDVLKTAGLPAAFDPNTVGSWEELTKATKTAGFELSSHYEGHARQAASTIENATSAVPGDKNTPVGFAKVFAGINEQAQIAIDLHNAKTPVYQQKGDLVSAETNFLKDYNPQMYSRRAISTVTPYPVTSDKELGRYLPGTFVQYKGKIVQVPPRPGAPPIPGYISDMHAPQPGQPMGPQQLQPAGQ